jgi:hypothetical protein
MDRPNQIRRWAILALVVGIAVIGAVQCRWLRAGDIERTPPSSSLPAAARGAPAVSP